MRPEINLVASVQTVHCWVVLSRNP